MAQIVKLRRSSVSGQKPTNSNLQLGELALNTTDGKVYMAKSGSLGPSVEELISTNTVNTGSIYLTGDITGSNFTGSFIGDGSQLINIPSSGVTGLELNKIISGSVSASISPDRGLEINTDVTISGSFPPGSPSASLKVYGNTEIDGYAKFLPVTATLNNSLSGSYIYVSGSTDDLYFSQNGKGYSNTTRLRWLEGNLYTGLLHGGNLTATVGGTTFNVSKGSGIIVELNASLTDDPYPTVKHIEWNDFTGQTLTYRTTHIQTFVGIDDNGEIHQQTGAFNDGQYNTLITLGTVIHQNLSTVNASITYPNVAYGYKQRTYDFIKAFGALKLSGLDIVPTGSLGLNVASGTAWADGRNYQNNPNNPSYIIDSGTNVSKIFRYYQVSGTTFVQDTNNGAGYTTIDPTKYVNNGTLTNVGGDYTIQRVYWYPNSATKGIVVYYGNAKYNTIRIAIDNLYIEPFVEIENTRQNAVYLGAIIIQGNGAFTNPNDFSLVPAGLFRNVGGSGGGGSIPQQRLYDLLDVDVTTQQDNDLLVYNVDTLKWESKKSLEGDYSITGSLSISGSVSGDGSGLTNLSNITGSIGQVAILNSDKTVSGSLLTHVTNDTFGIGTSDYNVDQPERLMVDGDESWNIATFQTTQNDNYAEVNIKNLGSGSNSSADLVIWNDISTETNNFLDLGMNSSNYNTGYLGYENDAYLITTGNDLYVGSLTTGSNGHIHLFGGNHWKSSSISIYNDSTIGINTDKDDNQASTIPSSIDGFAVEISGSVKFRNDILVSGSITSSYGVNTPIITNNGHNWEFLSSGQMRPAGTIMGSSYDSNQVDVQNLGPLLLKGMAYGAQVITSPDNGSTSHTWEFGTDGTLTAPGDVNVNGILTAKELHIDYVTSSVLYQSGSTKFGDTLDDTHNFTGSVNISGSINVNSITGSIDFTNLTNVPTLVSGSSQISYTGITDVPSGIVSGSSQILDGSGIWSGSSQLPSGIVSGSSQVSYNGITDVPSGIVSGSSQVIDLGFLTTSSFETFTSSYTTDSSSFDSRINLTTGSINSLNSFSSSVVLTSETASMTVLTSSYALTASYALNAGGGSGGGTLLGAYETLTQAVAASTWSFNHNIGQRYPIFQVFDNEGNVVIPTQIKTLDDNNAEIIFGSAQTGKVIASLGGGNGTTEGFTNSNLWVVDHNLGTDYPDVTIWDSNRRIIFPDRIESIDTNQIKIYFSVPVSGHVSVSRGGHILNGTASASSSAAPGTISGSLQIANLGYATTGSNTFTSNQTINGSLSLSNSLFKQTTITGSTATVGVTTISTTSYDGAFFDYVLKDGTNYRAGSIMSVWDGTTVKYTETTTNDIGDTSGVVMSVVLYGTTITLTATISSGTWTFKTMTRGM